MINHFLKKGKQKFVKKDQPESSVDQSLQHKKEKEELLKVVIEILGIFIAVEIYDSRRFRIDCSKGSKVLPALGFNAKKPFKNQDLYNALSILPLKIEMRKSEGKENGDIVYQIQTGFSHDILKNLFLFKGMDYELKNKEASVSLGLHNIAKNQEFVKFLVESFDTDSELKLRNFIQQSRDDLSKEVGHRSANAMTLLVAGGKEFENENLEGVRIPGASLRFGRFIGTNFRGADLKSAILSQASLDKCDMTGANLENIDTGVFPSLEHEAAPSAIIFCSQSSGPYKSSHLISFAEESGELVLWDTLTGTGEKRSKVKLSGKVLFKSFSPDKTKLVLGLESLQILILDLSSFAVEREIQINESCKFAFFDNKGDIVVVNHFAQQSLIKLASLNNIEKKTEVAVQDTYHELFPFASSKTGRLLGCAFRFKNKKSSVFVAIDIETNAVANIEWTSAVCGAAFAFDEESNAVAIGYEDLSFLIWELDKKQNPKVLRGHTKPISVVQYSPDGDRIVAGSTDYTIRIWAPSTGTLIESLIGHNSNLTSLAFSDDGFKIASGSLDLDVRVWKAHQDQIDHEIEAHSSAISALAFHPKYQTLASGSSDTTIRLWEVSTGKQKNVLEYHKATVTVLRFSPNGLILASGSEDQLICLWNVETGEMFKSNRGHTDKVKALEYCPSGQFLISGGEDNKIVIWGDSLVCVKQYVPDDANFKFHSFAASDQYLAISTLDCRLIFWDYNNNKTDREIKGLEAPASSLNFDENGSLLFFCSNSCCKFDVEANITTAVNEGDASARSLNLIMKDTSLILSFKGKEIFLIGLTAGEILQTIRPHRANVTALAFSPDENFFSAGFGDSMIIIWNRIVPVQGKGKVQVEQKAPIFNYNLCMGNHLSAYNLIMDSSTISVGNEIVFKQRGAVVINENQRTNQMKHAEKHVRSQLFTPQKAKNGEEIEFKYISLKFVDEISLETEQIHYEKCAPKIPKELRKEEESKETEEHRKKKEIVSTPHKPGIQSCFQCNIF